MIFLIILNREIRVSSALKLANNNITISNFNKDITLIASANKINIYISFQFL